MGRLPNYFAGRPITEREPYNMPGELILAASVTGTQFPANTYDHNIDKPFETHRMIPRITPLDSSGIEVDNSLADVSQEVLQSLVRVRIANAGRNVNFQKAAVLLSNLTKGTTERSWEFADPYYLITGEGYTISVDTLAFPTSFGSAGITQLRIEMNFQGFNIIIGPPTENPSR